MIIDLSVQTPTCTYTRKLFISTPLNYYNPTSLTMMVYYQITTSATSTAQPQIEYVYNYDDGIASELLSVSLSLNNDMLEALASRFNDSLAIHDM